MSQKKTESQTKKKAVSRFYVVRNIQDVRKNMTKRLENYHREFIKDPLQSGKEIVEDFRDDPRKAMDAIVEDSRVFVGDLRKEARKKVDNVVIDGKKLVQKARKDPRKTFTDMLDDSKDLAEGLVEDGKSFMEGFEKDARIFLDEMVDNGKKALDNLPGKRNLQKKIEKQFKSLPRQFNMPSKHDINLLTGRLEALSAKVDNLGKEISV